MKIKLTTPQSGFSLVELMVVITIIGILTSIAIPIGNEVMKRQRRLHATKIAVELRTALTNYYTEYRRFPALDPGSSRDTEVTTDGSKGLITALMAVPGAEPTLRLNRRGIQFFSTRPARSHRSPGVVKDGSGYKLNDPWGNPYIIVYDYDNDGQIEAPSLNGEGKELIPGTVAIWSHGPNQVLGKGTDSKTDDIYAF